MPNASINDIELFAQKYKDLNSGGLSPEEGEVVRRTMERQRIERSSGASSHLRSSSKYSMRYA